MFNDNSFYPYEIITSIAARKNIVTIGLPFRNMKSPDPSIKVRTFYSQNTNIAHVYVSFITHIYHLSQKNRTKVQKSGRIRTYGNPNRNSVLGETEL